MSVSNYNMLNIDVFYDELNRVCSNRAFEKINLGPVNSTDSLFLFIRNIRNSNRNILFAGGFHGNEKAGSLGILKFIEEVDEDILKNINLSFLPLVNPSGFRLSTRYNELGENPNSGFNHDEQNVVSIEGSLLLKHIDLIKRVGSDCFISLHEDPEESRFYLYTFENNDVHGEFTRLLVNTERKFFISMPDGYIAEDFCKDGVIFKAFDGSFEDFLFYSGVPFTSCTETPGMLDLDLRVKANVEIIKSSVRFFLN